MKKLVNIRNSKYVSMIMYPKKFLKKKSVIIPILISIIIPVSACPKNTDIRRAAPKYIGNEYPANNVAVLPIL